MSQFRKVVGSWSEQRVRFGGLSREDVARMFRAGAHIQRIQVTQGVSNMVVPSWTHVVLHVQDTQGVI